MVVKKMGTANISIGLTTQMMSAPLGKCAACVTRSTWGCSALLVSPHSTGSSLSPGRTWCPPTLPSPFSAPPSPSPTSSTSPASTGCSLRASTFSYRYSGGETLTLFPWITWSWMILFRSSFRCHWFPSSTNTSWSLDLESLLQTPCSGSYSGFINRLLTFPKLLEFSSFPWPGWPRQPWRRPLPLHGEGGDWGLGDASSNAGHPRLQHILPYLGHLSKFRLFVFISVSVFFLLWVISVQT